MTDQTVTTQTKIEAYRLAAEFLKTEISSHPSHNLRIVSTLLNEAYRLEREVNDAEEFDALVRNSYAAYKQAANTSVWDGTDVWDRAGAGFKESFTAAIKYVHDKYRSEIE